MAGWTEIEPVTFGLTGTNYEPPQFMSKRTYSLNESEEKCQYSSGKNKKQKVAGKVVWLPDS